MDPRRDVIVVPRFGARAVYASFIAFGFFWGAWGASLPSIRLHAGVTVGELGLSLALVGMGALPTMLIAGRAFDRFGPRAGGVALLVLGAAGIAVATLAEGLASLIVLMLATGAASGASDVAINAAAANAERTAGRPVITRAHGFFSLAVVVSSLGAGGLGSAGLPPLAIFVVVAMVAVVSSIMLGAPAPASASGVDTSTGDRRPLTIELSITVIVALATLGFLGALALAVENAHQSWSAVFLQDSLQASPIVASLGPACFAAVASAIRFGSGAVAGRIRPVALLCLGGAAATVGTALLATSSTVAVGLIGVIITAAGTAVCFPTLLSLVAAHSPAHLRGRVVSAVSSIAYLGFLFGPALVGVLSAAGGLRIGLLSVAGLAALFTVLAAPLAAWAARRLDRSLAG